MLDGALDAQAAMTRQRRRIAVGANAAAIQRPRAVGARNAHDRAHVAKPAAREHRVLVRFQRDLERPPRRSLLADRLGQADAEAAQIRFDAYAGLALLIVAGVVMKVCCQLPSAWPR